ncbi:MAG: hypothetical protein GY757_08110, partial [bacterium]|nr:hypothetical protein [bacterium]
NGDAFVAIMDQEGGLNFASYLGGSQSDTAYAIRRRYKRETDSYYLALTGTTSSPDFPLRSPLQGTKGAGADAFVTQLTNNSLYYSTFLGGNGDDVGKDITLGAYDSVAVIGYSSSTDFPAANTYQDSNAGGYDMFVSRLSEYGNGLLFSTYLGGTGDDYGLGLCLGFITGKTGSSDFPTANAYQASSGGARDAVVGEVSYSIPDNPILGISRDELIFAASPANLESRQSLYVNNLGSGSLTWQPYDSVSWLYPDTGIDSHRGSGVIPVQVDGEGLAPGTYTGTLNITAICFDCNDKSVDVTLKVYGEGETSAPFGEFSTPLEGAVVSSSVAVTGWALDDVEVESVKLYNGTTYIGDAEFVADARPDIEQAFPDYPQNHKAGWGYMLLTNFLPGGGNGSYQLTAKATDVEGFETVLGTKTITVDNTDSVKPFGAIDLPTQGGPVDGFFRNVGWVLTPMPNAIPENGSTIRVYVDGVYMGNARYNNYREDISSLFPGYANSDGAGVLFSFETAAFYNGIHQICWVVEDDAGNADGIGSRFFSIENYGTTPYTIPPNHAADFSFASSGGAPVEADVPIAIKKGIGTDPAISNIYRDKTGITEINVSVLEPLEISFDKDVWVLSGYMLVGEEMRRLPVGSTLKRNTKRFHWIPGPGFSGTYPLVFVLRTAEGKGIKKTIRVKVHPQSFTRKGFFATASE